MVAIWQAGKWRIGNSGKIGARPSGWEKASFRTLSKCRDAIEFAETTGQSFEDWQKLQRKHTK